MSDEITITLTEHEAQVATPPEWSVGKIGGQADDLGYFGSPEEAEAACAAANARGREEESP